MKNDIHELRNHLFATLDGLADHEKPMEVARAKAIADVARVIIDSAKAEIQLLHVTGARAPATEFIPVPSGAVGGGMRQLPGPGACPACGGRMKADTDGDGALVDRCTRCGRSPEPRVADRPVKASA
jgi:hypothetical protein